MLYGGYSASQSGHITLSKKNMILALFQTAQEEDLRPDPPLWPLAGSRPHRHRIHWRRLQRHLGLGSRHLLLLHAQSVIQVRRRERPAYVNCILGGCLVGKYF